MKKLAVLDIETDPFEYGVIPRPFVVEYFDGEKSIIFWGEDCIIKMVAALEAETTAIIYAHNGGKFDFIYFLEHLHADMRIINGRIIQAFLGKHQLRDSYAIMPFPLRDFDKDEIDYNKMHLSQREQHREEILKYLHKDCTSLHELVVAFAAEFGDALTIGGAALKQLKKFHKFDCGGQIYDGKFRNDFYFGGRNQVFRTGIIDMPLTIYDVNSMYPYVMKAFLHPVSCGIYVSRQIEPDTCFVIAEGENYGALPVRTKLGSLDFTKPLGRFCTTIHEWNAALDTGCFRPHRIIKTMAFRRRESFAEFVDHFQAARQHAKEIGDRIHDLFYKFTRNSAYGKFAQNPENFSEWMISKFDDIQPQPWVPAYIFQGKYIIWERPLDKLHYYNIATGASITGAARSLLLRGLKNATDPIYCDTDSIICRKLTGVPIDEYELGAWKVEAKGDLAAVGGKKLYGILQSGEPNKPGKEKVSVGGRPYWGVKKAHKGARLSFREVVHVAQGGTVEYCNPVPAFGLDGNHKFTKRSIRMTGGSK